MGEGPLALPDLHPKCSYYSPTEPETACHYQGPASESSLQRGDEAHASWQPPQSDGRLHPQKPLSIMDKSCERRVCPPAALSQMLSQPPADEPRPSKVSSRVFTSGFHALQAPQLYRTRPELSRASSPTRVRRARRAARPRTGFADASSGYHSERTMPQRPKNDCEGAARTIDERALGAPAARRGASTKSRKDANARRCRVTCRTRRRRGAAVGARKRKIAPSNTAVGGVFATHGIR